MPSDMNVEPSAIAALVPLGGSRSNPGRKREAQYFLPRQYERETSLMPTNRLLTMDTRECRRCHFQTSCPRRRVVLAAATTANVLARILLGLSSPLLDRHNSK